MKSLRAISLVTAVIGAALFLAPAAEATSIYDASFDENGDLRTSGSYTLDNFVVTGIYNGNMAFIYDGSVYGRIYGSSFVSTLQVGNIYSGTTITASVYFGYQEFTSGAGATYVSAGTFSPINIADISTISSTTVLAASPSAGPSYSILNAPVTFTFTPQVDVTLNTASSLYATDVNGTEIQFYRSASGDTLLAGQSYQVTGYVQTYQSLAEIVGATIVPIPEPGTVVLLGLGVGVGLLGLRRGKRA